MIDEHVILLDQFDEYECFYFYANRLESFHTLDFSLSQNHDDKKKQSFEK